jgi:hypothetical protein
MTYAERILNYLWSVAPKGATNGEIARALGIASQQTVYLATQDLRRQGLVYGEQHGRNWIFHAVESPDTLVRSRVPFSSRPALVEQEPATFASVVRRILEQRYRTELPSAVVPEVPKRFDFVSTDRQIIGMAHYYPRTDGTGLPPAKFSIIAEHVWLLEKTAASQAFLVFGSDREVPRLWLERYGHLAPDATFYFLAPDGTLETLREGRR